MVSQWSPVVEDEQEPLLWCASGILAAEILWLRAIGEASVPWNLLSAVNQEFVCETLPPKCKKIVKCIYLPALLLQGLKTAILGQVSWFSVAYADLIWWYKTLDEDMPLIDKS